MHETVLSRVRAEELRRGLHKEWRIAEGRLQREFVFENFARGWRFTEAVARAAEELGHHPDLHIYYGRVVIEIWTHTIGGLSIKDFELATKIDRLTIQDE